MIYLDALLSTKVQDVSKLKGALIDKAPGCFLCKWILEDLHLRGELTDHPKNANLEKPLFPEAAKVAHLKLEKIPLDS
jgi:hypothetical protein